MNKLIKIMVLALIANIAFASSEANIGFKSKLIEQGALTGTNLVTAGAKVELGSFGLAVDTFSSFKDNAGITKSGAGIFKRVDLTAGYKFTSTLADVTVGGVYANASKSFALGGIKSNVLPFVLVGGKAFTKLPWHVKVVIDSKNNNTNVDGHLELPFSVGLGKLKVVPLVGAGFNSASADVFAVKNNDKYYTGGLGLSYPSFLGSVRGEVFVASTGFSLNAEKTYGYNIGLSRSF
jgi:hypothetical protein